MGRILDAVVAAVDVPVTLKIRTGWDTNHKNGVRIAQIAEQAGIQALAVHGRTRSCYFKGEAEYDTIRAIKAAVSIPVIANGDIKTPEKAYEVLAHTGADGIMVGRAAQGTPWIFREIKAYLNSGQHLAAPSLSEIRETLTSHVQQLYEFYGPERGILIARKHVSWYSKGQRHGGQFRLNFNRLTTPDDQVKAIDDFFDELMTHE